MLKLSSTLLGRCAHNIAMSRGISNVTVIGAGLMGSGIAQVSAQSGYKVTLVDVNEDLLQKSVQNINTSLDRVAKKKFKDNPEQGTAFVAKVMNNLKTNTKAGDAAKEADLVVEAVVENLQLKHKIFKELDAAAPSHCLFASNTSSLNVSDLSAAVPDRAGSFGGLHFFNPVPVMRLVEVVRTPATTDSAFNQLMDFGRGVGKTAVPCKDTPGFIVNRLLVPYMMEAVRMLERGDANPQDIDVAMKLGAGYPMGPIELADYVGLDTCKFIIDGWAENYPNVQLFQPSQLLNSLVREGKVGRKCGEGFYKWDKKGNKM